MKKIVTAFLIMVLFVGTIGTNAYAVKSDDTQSIESVIESYYSSSYDMWWNLEMGDLSPYLDMESTQSYNRIDLLQYYIDCWKYLIEKEYCAGTRERNEVNFDFKTIDIKGNMAEVNVVLTGKTSKPVVYPEFVSLGENIFEMTKINNRWLITSQRGSSQSGSDPYLNLVMKTEKLALDNEKMKQKVDFDYSNILKSSSAANNVASTSLGAVAPMATYYSYDIERAARYAYNWVYSYNTALFPTVYNSQPPYDELDCTNFASQCVAYGFGSTSNFGSASSYRWVSGTWASGWTNWQSAGNFWNYMFDTTKTVGPHAQQNVYGMGSVLQLSWNNDWVMEHSAVCIGFIHDEEGVGVLTYAQHTGPALHSYIIYLPYNSIIMRPDYFVAN